MSDRRSILVLGAGTDQLPVYAEARRRGLRVIGVDRRADAPAAALCDEFHAVSTRDTEAVDRVLAGRPVAGILAVASDASLATQYELSRRHGLAFQPSLEATRASMDKGCFLAMVRALGFPHYPFAQSEDPGELLAAAWSFRFPVVVKPADGSGGKGITFVREPGDLAAAIAYAREFSFDGQILVEQCVHGRHYAVEVFIRDGRVHFLPVTEKVMTELPFMVTQGHLIPARIDDGMHARFTRMIGALCRAMRVENGPVNFDIVVTPRGEVHFIEVGARLGGNGYPRLMKRAFGVDTVRATVQIALGEPFELTPARSHKALLWMLGLPTRAGEGVLARIEGLDELRRHPNVEQLELLVEPGGRVRPYTQNAHRLGFVVAAGATYEEVENALDLARAVRFECEPAAVAGGAHAAR